MQDLLLLNVLNLLDGASASASVLLDTFTDTNGTDIEAHTPDTAPGGSVWTSYAYMTGAGVNGAAEIQSNQLQLNTDATVSLIDSGISDLTLTVDWTPQAGARDVIAVRGKDGDEMWFVAMRRTAQDIRIIEVTPGSLTTRDTASFTFVNGTTYTIKIVCSGTSIAASIDGTPYVSFASSSYQNETLVGLGRELATAATSRFDDLEVTT